MRPPPGLFCFLLCISTDYRTFLRYLSGMIVPNQNPTTVVRFWTSEYWEDLPKSYRARLLYDSSGSNTSPSIQAPESLILQTLGGLYCSYRQEQFLRTRTSSQARNAEARAAGGEEMGFQICLLSLVDRRRGSRNSSVNSNNCRGYSNGNNGRGGS